MTIDLPITETIQKWFADIWLLEIWETPNFYKSDLDSIKIGTVLEKTILINCITKCMNTCIYQMPEQVKKKQQVVFCMEHKDSSAVLKFTVQIYKEPMVNNEEFWDWHVDILG